MGWKCSSSTLHTHPQSSMNSSENAGAPLPGAGHGGGLWAGMTNREFQHSRELLRNALALSGAAGLPAEGQGHPGVGLGVWVCKEGEP